MKKKKSIKSKTTTKILLELSSRQGFYLSEETLKTGQGSSPSNVKFYPIKQKSKALRNLNNVAMEMFLFPHSNAATKVAEVFLCLPANFYTSTSFQDMERIEAKFFNNICKD